MNRYAPKRIKADSDAQDPDIGVAQASVMIYLCCMGKAVKTLQGLRAAALLLVLVMEATPVAGEENLITLPLNDAAQVKPRNVTVKAVRYRDSDALEVRQTGPYRGFDTDTFAFVPGLDFHDGTIEVDVARIIACGRARERARLHRSRFPHRRAGWDVRMRGTLYPTEQRPRQRPVAT